MATQECPCGHLGDPRKPCTCHPGRVAKYLSRLSGPLLDRIDIHVEVPSLGFEQLSRSGQAETSARVRERVQKARAVQDGRFASKSRSASAHCNAQMSPKQMRQHCRLDNASQEMLRLAVDRLGLSARAYDRILKVARTVADLDGKESIQARHLSEAIQYRTLDRRGRAGA